MVQALWAGWAKTTQAAEVHTLCGRYHRHRQRVAYRLDLYLSGALWNSVTHRNKVSGVPLYQGPSGSGDKETAVNQPPWPHLGEARHLSSSN